MPKAGISNGRLDSWKDIAAYLGRDVRTAIRWEKSKGLPVRRIPGGRRQAVFAYAAELDAWLGRAEDVRSEGTTADSAVFSGSAGSAIKQQVASGVLPVHASVSFFNISKRWLIYGSVILLIAGGALFILFRPRTTAAEATIPVRVGFTSNAIEAFDEAGRTLWTHRFDGQVTNDMMAGDEARPVNRTQVADFRGDGNQEVLAVVPLRTDINKSEANRWEVDLFSSRGKLLWSYVPRGTFQFGNHELVGPWVVSDIFVSGGRSKPQIWVVAGQTVWGNSFVVDLDPITGKDTLRFVNTGMIHSLTEIRESGKTYLLLGGFDNEQDTGSLAIVDEAKPFAASPQSVGSRHKCVSCPAGDPDYYFVFPRSEINEIEQMHEDGVIQVTVTGEEIQIRKVEARLQKNNPQMIYLLSAADGFRVSEVRFESGYDMLHREFEKDGTLDHTLENCPERLHPRPVKVWTPAGGWGEIRLQPSASNQ